MSNQFMVSYVYEQEDGYAPITQDVLKMAVNAIREALELPESVNIMPLGFFRLEEGEK